MAGSESQSKVNLLVIVPTRGRPENAKRLAESWATFAVDADLMFCVDKDDPKLGEYLDVLEESIASVFIGPRLRLGGTLNLAAAENVDDYDALGFMGDDHLPRTEGWCDQVLAALESLGKVGIVYGNDLLQGERLPTAVFMTSSIPKTLGYMVPPGMVHMYLDDFWLTLGRKLGKIIYLPETIIEHIHPGAGKAAWDERYEEVNKELGPDKEKFEQYCAHQLDKDVEELLAL